MESAQQIADEAVIAAGGDRGVAKQILHAAISMIHFDEFEERAKWQQREAHYTGRRR